MELKKSKGTTPTEMLLSDLCERTFLKLWSYANPYKDDGKELCDLIAVFGDTVFIFFDREKKFDFQEDKEPGVFWERWKRRAVEAQIKTAYGAEKYLRRGNKIYIDNKRSTLLPLKIDLENARFHKIIVAHGAAEACLAYSEDNVSGSLAISYGDGQVSYPFFINLDRENPIHVLDSHTLPLIMEELDTIDDFSRYLEAKSEAIAKFKCLSYCGEEDLLAHYMYNFDEETKKHLIGPKDNDIDFVMIGEGEWRDFSASDVYRRTKSHNEVSYLWDEIIQRTADNALKGKTLGTNPLEGKSAIHEMAREPRFVRRVLSKNMIRAINNFPEHVSGIFRNLSMMPSFQKNKAYIFLQMYFPNELKLSPDYREKRQAVLEVACGAAKVKFPELNIVVGILIEAPKHSDDNSEDFIVMYCDTFSEGQYKYYRELGDEFGFFKTGKPVLRTAHQFVNDDSDE